mmetsp:Transcript_103901/g.303305  ORF Transcript_103901/g.303305 Transcript_103901/m.303305 type:complete len:270 (+) Transcript_103901:525-1334(+)
MPIRDNSAKSALRPRKDPLLTRCMPQRSALVQLATASSIEAFWIFQEDVPANTTPAKEHVHGIGVTDPPAVSSTKVYVDAITLAAEHLPQGPPVSTKLAGEGHIGARVTGFNIAQQLAFHIFCTRNVIQGRMPTKSDKQLRTVHQPPEARRAIAPIPEGLAESSFRRGRMISGSANLPGVSLELRGPKVAPQAVLRVRGRKHSAGSLELRYLSGSAVTLTASQRIAGQQAFQGRQARCRGLQLQFQCLDALSEVLARFPLILPPVPEAL